MEIRETTQRWAGTISMHSYLVLESSSTEWRQLKIEWLAVCVSFSLPNFRNLSILCPSTGLSTNATSSPIRPEQLLEGLLSTQPCRALQLDLLTWWGPNVGFVLPLSVYSSILGRILQTYRGLHHCKIFKHEKPSRALLSHLWNQKPTSPSVLEVGVTECTFQHSFRGCLCCLVAVVSFLWSRGHLLDELLLQRKQKAS